MSKAKIDDLPSAEQIATLHIAFARVAIDYDYRRAVVAQRIERLNCAVWADLLVAMEADEELSDLARYWRQLIASTIVPEWRQAQPALGLSRVGIRGIGIAPEDEPRPPKQLPPLKSMFSWMTAAERWSSYRSGSSCRGSAATTFARALRCIPTGAFWPWNRQPEMRPALAMPSLGQARAASGITSGARTPNEIYSLISASASMSRTCITADWGTSKSPPHAGSGDVGR